VPDYSIEQSFSGIIAGVDEAGRGPWAGPVVAGAVILDANNIPEGINDSKKLPKKKREELLELINITSIVGVGIASVQEIDDLNILAATMLAMRRAVADLSNLPQLALIDGNKAPELSCKTETIIKGDSKSLSIAAASIVAKVTRDRIMKEIANDYPHYGWEKNAGYGTKLHQGGLARHGVTEHHRRSFKPIRTILASGY